MRMLKSSKGFYIPALAVLALVIIIFIIYATHNPAVKQTTVDFIGAATGHP